MVSLFHSNSERGYLAEVMRARLEEEIKVQWGEVREGYYAKGEKEGGGEEQEEGFEEVFKDESVTVEVSRVDRDPFGIVVLQGSEVEGMKI